ncbi:hypothetical protein O6H91_15G051000 [Diphasiastrum complanatum]|uniref:Uncharacterized protein n=1 Tax=Diphasiastrum complanatum TaxID=34168 RepID=A0ACC2BI35_DIPCM|nr:hypothetical protein O6H91_Y230200 [Diphasiastrum complanatum]KAJ7529452.1 hypothetical protein O6H91_15G051000 [Diphasiastrum complanatum]
MMQQIGSDMAPYDDQEYFGRSESFMMEDAVNHANNSSSLLVLADTLEKQLEASNIAIGDIPSDETALCNDLNQSGEFDLEDNGQLLQDMLQQQQQTQSESEPLQKTQCSAVNASSWEESLNVMIMLQDQQQHQLKKQSLLNPGPKFPRESELLSLLQLPRYASVSMQGSAGLSQFNSVGSTGVVHPVRGMSPYNITNELSTDVHHLVSPLPAQHFLPQPSLRHLLRNLPHTTEQYLSKSTMSRQPQNLVDLEEREATGHDDSRFLNGTLFDTKREFHFGKGEPRGINHFATERQRREYLNEKYQTLRSLVPNPSKADRASIVADAIEYVKELKRTVQELQLLLQDKRCGSSKKRLKVDDSPADMESTSQQSLQVRGQEAFVSDASQLRSSWLQRTSQQGTQVDVRIVDNEVNIKVTQRKRRNCLLNVMLILHELRLDILHANGASIGEHHIFMFNTKIMEGSSIFAGHVATKLIEAVDRHSPQFAPSLC